MTDPYRHCPGLSGKIDDPAASFMRTLSIPVLEALCRDNNLPGGWWYSDDQREALRRSALAGRLGQDLWVFGYGSLMWDPALHFCEIRRAQVEGFSRKFILRDSDGGRGTPEAPALMAALGQGGSCAGLAFRIDAALVDAETYLLWQREMVAPGYLAQFVPVRTAQGDIDALTFVADPEADDVCPGLTPAEQITMIASASGVLGTSADYLRNVVAKLNQLGIEDRETKALWTGVAKVLSERKTSA
jgi:cation transport protein ChaC